MTKKIRPLENPVYEGIRAESVLLKHDINLLKSNFQKIKTRVADAEFQTRELKRDNSRLRKRNTALEADLKYARKHIRSLRGKAA